MRFVRSILALSAIAYAVPASAAVQIFDFEARIDWSNSPYGTGTLFSGKFSYDDALVPSSSYHLDPAGGFIWTADGAEYQSPQIALSFVLGGQTFTGGGTASVFDMIDQGLEDGDMFFIGNYGPRYSLNLSFESNAATLLDTRLPATFPAALWQGPTYENDDDFNEVDLMPRGEFGFHDAESDSGFNARVLSITRAGGAVPEPSIWAMMIIGFFAIGGVLRRQRRAEGSLVPSA